MQLIESSAIATGSPSSSKKQPVRRCSCCGMFLESSAIVANNESSKQKHVYGDVAATTSFLGVTQSPQVASQAARNLAFGDVLLRQVS